MRRSYSKAAGRICRGATAIRTSLDVRPCSCGGGGEASVEGVEGVDSSYEPHERAGQGHGDGESGGNGNGDGDGGGDMAMTTRSSINVDETMIGFGTDVDDMRLSGWQPEAVAAWRRYSYVYLLLHKRIFYLALRQKRHTYSIWSRPCFHLLTRGG